MWILPKQLHTSDFVPDTAALSLDSTELSEICARSLFVRSKPSAARIWSQKWKRDSWTQHLSGRILNPSHGQIFVTAWTSSLGAIPASHLAQPESASAQTTLATSGLLSQTEFVFCDPDSASLKMWKDISPSDSEKSLESWNQLVIKARGEYSLRLKSAHRTKESASSSWPTIRASEYKDTGPIGSKSHDHMLGKGYLCAVVTQDAWQTPTTNMDMVRSEEGVQKRIAFRASIGRKSIPDGNLGEQMQRVHGQAAPANHNTHGSRQESWATPRVGGEEKAETRLARGKDIGLHGQVGAMNNTAKLNPRWVETLMGLPVGWVMPSCASPVTIEPTSFDSSATESCLPQPSELLEF